VDALRAAATPTVEPQHRGEFLVIDVDLGGYEVDADAPVASPGCPTVTGEVTSERETLVRTDVGLYRVVDRRSSR
jgi:hypothetical protein